MDEHDPLIDRLRDLGRQPLDSATAFRHLSAMASVGGRSARAAKLKVGAAFFAGLMLGGTGLATAGALPGPAQDVAHSALSNVGVAVPNGHGPARYNGPECGTDPQTNLPFRNHGQYVRAHAGDPNAGASRCGKPLHAGTPTSAGTSKDTEQPGTTETTEKPEAPDNAGNPGKGHANKAGKANSGKNQGDQGNDNESPEPTDGPELGGVAPKTVTPTSTSTSTTSTSTTSTSPTSTTVAHP